MPSDGTEQTQATTGDYQLINRVLSYAPVEQLVNSTKTYYTSAKEYSPVVKSVSENLEQRLEDSIKLVTPTVQKVNPTLQPYLTAADAFAVNQLDRAENLAESLQSSSKAVQTRVTEVAVNSRETLEKTVLPTVDSYLKNSTLARPLTFALDVTEKAASTILPLAEAQPTEGPVYRAGQLTVRIGGGLSTRYNDLKTDAPQKASELIQTARQNLDKSVAAANQFVVQATAAHLAAVVQEYSKETITQLYAALEALSAKVPEDLKQKAAGAYEQLSNRNEVAALAEALRINGEKLQHAAEALSTYIKNNEHIPTQLANVTDLLTSVVENLLAHGQKTAAQ